MSLESEFISRMSHDVRTPLNGILGLTSLALEEATDPAMRAYLEKIQYSGELLAGLLNNMLDMNTLEKGEMKYCPVDYPYEEIYKLINTVIKPQCDVRHIVLNQRIKSEPLTILTDRIRFNQVLLNLLDNAVKFTPDGGTVDISYDWMKIDKNMTHLEITIADDGRGMSEDFQKRMYDMFTQEQEHISEKQGTGLGLGIAKSLVEGMGGSLNCWSREGEGTIFQMQFEFPYKSLPEIEIRRQEIEELPLKGRKILIVEDQAINREIVRKVLMKEKALTYTAENGKEGLKILEDSKDGFFDIILMDIRMPVMDGVEATKAIRSLPRNDAKQIPIIAMTANAFEQQSKECFEAGMTAHMAKPFRREALISLISQCVRQAKKAVTT